MTRPPGWDDFVPEEPPLIPAAAYVEKSIGISPATSPPAGWEDTIPERNSFADSPPLENMGSSEETTRPPGFENIRSYQEANIGSSAETARPPGFENIGPHLEENIGSSAEATGPPGFGNINSNPSFFSASINLEKSMNTSPETSPPHGWEDTRSQPNPRAENLEKSVDISLATSLPSGGENPDTPHNPLAGSVDQEQSKCSSPETTRPSGWLNLISQSNPHPEVGQMVCGSCRQLLSYPRGAMHVKCPCCQIVNFVLEEHQVGNVKCGKCSMLLMYPYGASCVRCSSCRFVTEIGAHNARPPLSVHQGRFSMPQNPVH